MSAEHHTENEIFLAKDQVTVYMPCHADAKNVLRIPQTVLSDQHYFTVNFTLKNSFAQSLSNTSVDDARYKIESNLQQTGSCTTECLERGKRKRKDRKCVPKLEN